MLSWQLHWLVMASSAEQGWDHASPMQAH